MATHSSILAWRIPWTEETDSPWGHKESDMTEQLTLSLQVIGNWILTFTIQENHTAGTTEETMSREILSKIMKFNLVT